MTITSEGVRCIIQDGEVSMFLHDVRVHIPSHLLKESKIVPDVLSSLSESPITRDFTLAAPTEWLQAWVACYVRKVKPLADADTEDLVNCLKVCCAPES
jgi:hypothetical protein